MVTLNKGQMLAHYRLAEPIGEGGMGVVWSAEDTKLGRQVAVKVLPGEFASDPQRLARFEREAKLLATLNHPNVAAIYGFDHADGVHFLVLELVPGPTLAEMIKAGPVPVDEALDICRQVAEGLEAAHAAGVIHRDLKPGNVKVTPDGKVKVLDFGLAKGLEGTVGSSASDLSLSPTVAVGGTRAGVVLGTAPYMSPEQARGKSLDARTDIWSFGCVLYECLTGRLLFTGETVTDVLSAILQTDPDWTVLPEKTPPRVRELLARCLERSPRNRLHHIADARIEIERAVAGREWTTSGIAAAEPASLPGAPGRSRGVLGGWAGLAAGLILGAAAAWLAMAWMAPEPPSPPVRRFGLITKAGSPRLPRISPDGRYVAYLESDRVWIRDLGELQPREVPGTEGTSLFAWSPDSRWLAVSMNGKLWKLPAAGGQASLLCDLPESLNPSNAAGIAWGDEGRVAYNLGSGGVMAVPEQGGAAVSIVEPAEGEVDFHTVTALPGGRGYMFAVHRPGGFDVLAAITPAGRRDLITLEGQNLNTPTWSPTGHLVFERSPDNPGLWAVPFSLERLEVTGEPFPVEASEGSVSVSSEGTLVHDRGAAERETRLVRVDRNGLVTGTIGEPQLGQGSPALSPDGSLAAAVTLEAGNPDIWIYDLAAGTRRRLTFEESPEFAPEWLPSGREVAYSRSGTKVGEIDILATAADGSGETRTLARGARGRFSRDGRFMIYSAPDEQLDQDLWWLALDGGSEPVQLLETDGRFHPGFSPDGRYVVFASTDTGRSEVYLTRFPSGEGRWQVSSSGGEMPRWNASGDRIFFVSGSDLMEVSVTTGASPSLGTPRKLFTFESIRRGYAVAGDGREFIMAQETDPGATDVRIVVVESWAAGFSAAE